MTEFTLHTENTAPADCKATLVESTKPYGSIPGLHAVMAWEKAAQPLE